MRIAGDEAKRRPQRESQQAASGAVGEEFHRPITYRLSADRRTVGLAFCSKFDRHFLVLIRLLVSRRGQQNSPEDLRRSFTIDFLEKTKHRTKGGVVARQPPVSGATTTLPVLALGWRVFRVFGLGCSSFCCR